MAGKTFEQLISESSVPVFVDFYADWCAPCCSLAPSVKRLAEEFSG
ncbi:thioredoxin, partial [Prosthecochloris vibrioformis]